MPRTLQQIIDGVCPRCRSGQDCYHKRTCEQCGFKGHDADWCYYLPADRNCWICRCPAGFQGNGRRCTSCSRTKNPGNPS
jgi:hypothetical protein